MRSCIYINCLRLDVWRFMYIVTQRKIVQKDTKKSHPPVALFFYPKTKRMRGGGDGKAEKPEQGQSL